MTRPRRHTALSAVLALVAFGLLPVGCARDAEPGAGLDASTDDAGSPPDARAPESIELALNIYAAAGSPDPLADVAFIRLAVEDPQGTLVHEEFGGYPSLPTTILVPALGSVRVSAEGWAANPGTNTVGTLLSRGRSMPLTVPDDAPGPISIMMGRLNDFSLTTGAAAPHVATTATVGRVGHTLTVLADGRALVLGGMTLKPGVTGDWTSLDQVAEVIARAAVYDPATGAFSVLPLKLAEARALHSATRLADGRVLVAGGIGGDPFVALDSIEILSPDATTSALVEGGITARAGHTATLLDGAGGIVFVGGFVAHEGDIAALGSLEVYCPPGAECAPAGQVIHTSQLSEPRYVHTATLATVGEASTTALLIAGGEGANAVRASLETFNLAPLGLDPTLTELPGGPRTRHTGTWIASQSLAYLIGGFSDKSHLSAVQPIAVYGGATRAFQITQRFVALTARGGHSAVELPGNRILQLGGFAGGLPLDAAEVVFEYKAPDGAVYIDRGGVPPMAQPRGGGQSVLLGNDTVLVVGGLQSGGTPNLTGEWFNPL